MTHQRKDVIKFNSKEFVLLDTEDGKLIYDCFIEIDEPISEYSWYEGSSALWRGHQERYEIKEKQLWGQMVRYRYNPETSDKIMECSALKPILYTGSCVIGKRSYSDDWLQGYLKGDEAYELHFSSGYLDECRDLRDGIEFYNRIFLESKFYVENEDQRNLHLKYDEAIAFHYLKYKYHPIHSMYWRDPEDNFLQLSEESKEKWRKEFEDNYQELLHKINRLRNEAAVYIIRDRYVIPEKGLAYSITPNSKILKKDDVVYDLHGNCFVVKEMPVSRLHMCSFFLMDDVDYIFESQNGIEVHGDILVDVRISQSGK